MQKPTGLGRWTPGAVLAFIVALVIGSVAEAQYFGRNKVQWENFDFHVLKTEHFDIYYYPRDNQAAVDAGRMAERWYARLSRVFGHSFADRKPIVLYANHADFQQTTTTGGLISEGVGGFTEPLQDRLVMPLTGNYADTDHVLGHEMVHEFQFDIAGTLTSTNRGQASRLQQLPLWVIEGLAEYLSVGRVAPQTAMWLRDALIADELPDLDDLSRDPSYFPYRWGHAFWAYVGGRWGDPAVINLFIAAMQLGVEGAVEAVLGLSEDQFSNDWKDAIRRAYPAEMTRVSTAGATKVLGEGGRRDLNLAPVVSPDGERVAYLSSRDLFTIGLYVADADTGRDRERLASSGSEPHFDALRFIDSAGSWSPDGGQLAVVVFARGDNQIALMDADSGRVLRRFAVPGVSELSNTAWSPDGRWLAVSGSTLGVTDLHLIDLETGAATALTDDRYAELQPAFSPDGQTLAFVTDRGPETDFEELRYGNMRLGLMDVQTRDVRVLELFDGAKHINPQFSPDGNDLYFIADPGGIANVFRYSLATGELFRVTDVPTGVTGITDLSPSLSVARTSGRLMYSVFEKGNYNVYELDPAAARGVPVTGAVVEANAGVLPPATARGETVVGELLDEPELGLPAGRRFDVKEYRPKLGLAFIGPPSIGVGVDRYGLGIGGGLSAYFTDVLGEHQVGVALQGGSSNRFGTDIGAQATYLNRAHRINWGVAGTHVPFLSAATYVYQDEVNVGGEVVTADVIEQLVEQVTIDEAALLSTYPFSLTRRVEVNGSWTRLSYERQVERLIVVGGEVIARQEANIPAPESLSYGQASIAWVGDSSYFGFTSPVRGTRFRFEVGQSFGEFDFQTVLADFRTYGFFNPLSLAFRGLHFGRYGGGAEHPRLSRLYVGRETLVRGYSVGDFDIDECTTVEDDFESCPEFDRLVGSRLAVANVELRFQAIGTEGFGLINFPYLPTELSLFVDAGVAWDEDTTPELRFDRDTTDRVPVVSAGIAARILLGGYIPLQVYYAKPFQRPREDRVVGIVISPGW